MPRRSRLRSLDDVVGRWVEEQDTDDGQEEEAKERDASGNKRLKSALQHPKRIPIAGNDFCAGRHHDDDAPHERPRSKLHGETSMIRVLGG